MANTLIQAPAPDNPGCDPLAAAVSAVASARHFWWMLNRIWWSRPCWSRICALTEKWAMPWSGGLKRIA